MDRPWAVDDLDQVLQCWQRKRYCKALLFVDNAGSDIILGRCTCVHNHDSNRLLQQGRNIHCNPAQHTGMPASFTTLSPGRHSQAAVPASSACLRHQEC